MGRFLTKDLAISALFSLGGENSRVFGYSDSTWHLHPRAAVSRCIRKRPSSSTVLYLLSSQTGLDFDFLRCLLSEPLSYSHSRGLTTAALCRRP